MAPMVSFFKSSCRNGNLLLFRGGIDLSLCCHRHHRQRLSPRADLSQHRDHGHIEREITQAHSHHGVAADVDRGTSFCAHCHRAMGTGAHFDSSVSAAGDNKHACCHGFNVDGSRGCAGHPDSSGSAGCDLNVCSALAQHSDSTSCRRGNLHQGVTGQNGIRTNHAFGAGHDRHRGSTRTRDCNTARRSRRDSDHCRARELCRCCACRHGRDADNRCCLTCHQSRCSACRCDLYGSSGCARHQRNT